MWYHSIKRESILVTFLILLYIAVFGTLSIVRYQRYNATGWDLGIFSQLTWNASHGRFLQNTTAEYNNMLAIHSVYITILLAPLYWIWSDPQVLLVAQTIILAAGAWPVARLAQRTLDREWVAPAFAALWLFFPALGWLNRWDFHPIALVAPFLAFAYEAADRRAWRQVDGWLLLALLCKEEVGLNVALFGLFMAWQYGRRCDVCLLWGVIGVGWFVGHAFVVFPMLRDAPLPIHAQRYQYLMDGDFIVIWEYLTGPDLLRKLKYLAQLFAPSGFFAVLAPVALLPALSTLGFNLLTDFWPQFTIYMHYTAPIIPVVIVAAIFGIARLQDYLPHARRVLVFAVSLALIAETIVWTGYSPVFGSSGKLGIYAWEEDAHIAALDEVKNLIPLDACVVTENNIHPHYSTRREVYVVGARGPGPVGDADGCTYMIIDLGDHRHDDFVVAEEVACYQYWSQKRVPIYFRDTVVVLKQAPATVDPHATQQMDTYCRAYSG